MNEIFSSVALHRTNDKPLSEPILTQFLGVWVKVELSIDDIDHIAIAKMHFSKMANEKMRTFIKIEYQYLR